MLSSGDFLVRLSSGDPVPGGGSVAALQTAMAASLLAMVANLTLGRPKYADVASQVESILVEAVLIRDHAAALAEEDVEAYGKVAAAMALPRGDEDDKIRRRTAIQDALKAAAVPPLETMRAADRVSQLAGDLVRIGNRSAISDVGTAALAARAGFHAARLNVEINLASIRDEEWVAEMRLQLRSLADPDALEAAVLRESEAAIRGERA